LPAGACCLPPPGWSGAGIAIFLERKREAARQDPAWIARQGDKVKAGVAAVAAAVAASPRRDGPVLGEIAWGCALFWLEFRLPEFGWRAQYPALREWAEALEARASFSSTRPPR
jgi:glutathione S-transferase